MKRLLMIVPFFPPVAGGGVYRPLAFVRYMDKFGWQPTVITPHGGSFWITDDALLKSVPDNCEVRRTRALSGQSLLGALRRSKGASQVRPSRRFGLLRKLGSMVLVPDTYIGWSPFAVREGREVLRKGGFDAIYSTSPPETSHLVGLKLHRISKLPWIADFRDPWMNRYLFPPPTPLHARWHDHLERKVCSNANVVVATRWHRELFETKYRAIRRPELISNGYDHHEFEPLSELRPSGDRVTILHAGMLTLNRTAVPFLRALKLFLDNVPEAADRCRAVFLGARESENDAEAQRLGLGGVVEFRDTAPHGESLKLERVSHILLLIKHVNPVYNGMVPGKLFEYIGAGRPILALTPEGEASDIIRRLNRGEVVAQDDTAQIAERIELMFRKFARGELDKAYDLSPAPEYQRERLTGRLCELLDRVVMAKD
jgi:glycosyltransferase involved in cell wall biosynthesis